MADSFIVLQVFRLLTANHDLEEAVLQGVIGMLISLLMLCSLIVLSVENIHLLLVEVFQGWFSFWFEGWTFCIWLHWYLCLLVTYTGNYTGDKQIVPRDWWRLVGLLQTHLTVTMHLYKLNFVQRFCRLFLSRFRGWKLLSRIRLMHGVQAMPRTALLTIQRTLTLITAILIHSQSE